MNEKQKIWKNAMNKIDEKYILEAAELAPVGENKSGNYVHTDLRGSVKKGSSGNVIFAVAAAAAVIGCTIGAGFFLGDNSNDISVASGSSVTTSVDILPPEEISSTATENNPTEVIPEVSAVTTVSGAIAESAITTEEKTQELSAMSITDEGAYKIKDKVLYITEGVAKIDDYFFEDRTDFEKVVIPETVTEIGEGAFHRCYYLSEAELPESLTAIGKMAFKNSGLDEIVIPDGVVEIKESAFEDCTGLIHITLPKSLRIIGKRAFAGDYLITRAPMPPGLEVIEAEAFSGCKLFSLLTIPEDLERIDETAFEDCVKLKLIYNGEDYPYEKHSEFFARFALDKQGQAMEELEERVEYVYDTPLNILGDCYKGDNGLIHVSDENWEVCDDYDILRKYFFGTWGESVPTIIDDSEKADIAKYYGSIHFVDFYKVSDTVYAMRYGGSAGGQLYWIDTNEPDLLCRAEGSPGGSPHGILYDEELKMPMVWGNYKTDALVNEPENGFLSVFRLRELAKKHGIDYSQITDFEIQAEDGARYHDGYYYFSPMYLISESDERLVIKTTAQNADTVYFGAEETEVTVTFEKLEGKWSRKLDYAYNGGSTYAENMFIIPTDNLVITTYFGYDEFRGGVMHDGIDISWQGCNGSHIYAAASGTVKTAVTENTAGEGMGKYVVISHPDGYETLYGHCGDIFVKEGQSVAQGDVIGVIGSTGWSTGPHLHFSITKDGEQVNPLDCIAEKDAVSFAEYISEKRQLTLEDVKVLAKKGSALGWKDFEEFIGIEIDPIAEGYNADVYTVRYEISEHCRLEVNGEKWEMPYTIRLEITDENGEIIRFMDIREGGLEEFIEEIM